MQQLVRVQKCYDDQTVLVIPVTNGFCLGSCQGCAGCNQSKMQLRKVKNSINATCGQVVMLTTNRILKLLIRAGCLLPLLLLFVGIKEWGSIGGISGFFFGLVCAFLLFTREKEVYTITELSKRPKEKGDNDLD